MSKPFSQVASSATDGNVTFAVANDEVHGFGMMGDTWCDDDELEMAGTPEEHGFGEDPGDWPVCSGCLEALTEEFG